MGEYSDVELDNLKKNKIPISISIGIDHLHLTYFQGGYQVANNFNSGMIAIILHE